jgi:hypothetical protein
LNVVANAFDQRRLPACRHNAEGPTPSCFST